ncbi:MAG TPA: methionyl-tRNA formyltransferase [Candidatus Omnitrophota bacterium]|nr:methionyl-tRNA formyltransferase [Candidatus Omnitrophota bacterium]
MKIVFMGTPAPAAACLQALIDAEEQIACVVTQPDRPKGRNLRVTASPVKELAMKYKIPVESPEKAKDPIFINKIRSLDPELIVVVAYGKILPKELLSIPKRGAINVHASLLPKYRGAAPVQWALLNGDNETGVTVMQISETLDTGDIILQDTVTIDPQDNSATLLDKLFARGAQTLLLVVDQIKKGTAKASPQNETEATYAPSITKESGEIDWKRSAMEINNRVRAMIPWPVAHTFYKGKMLRLWSAEPVSVPGKFQPGEIVDVRDDLIVACGAGSLLIQELQLEGGRKMGAHDFVRGHRLAIGDSFPS